MPTAITNAPFPNRIQLILTPLIGPLAQSALGAFDPRRDLTVYADGDLLTISSYGFDAPNNRYLLYASKPFNLQGVIQIEFHITNPPFVTSTCNTATVLVVTPNPAASSALVLLQATVTPTFGGVLIPTGTIQFYDGITPLGSPVVLISGLAEYSTSTLSMGTHVLSAQYISTGLFNASVSNNVNEVIS
jgi:hypothetical protein